MQQYDNKKGKRRELDILKMKLQEVEEYYLQYTELSKKEKNSREKEIKEKIRQSKKDNFYEWILAVKLKNGKLIGKIEVMDMGSGIAFFTINLPNEIWQIRYGIEAIKQFAKICNENKYFKKIELDPKNAITKKFVEVYEEKEYLDKYSINVEKVA